jgi:hypothetical protein
VAKKAKPPRDRRTPQERTREAASWPEDLREMAKWPEGLREKAKLPTRQHNPPKRKRERKGMLTPEQKAKGFAYLRKHPTLTPKQAYPLLRKALKTKASPSTLWRTFWRKP